jgi:hypothetical protein
MGYLFIDGVLTYKLTIQSHKLNQNMKNSIKVGFFALAIAVSAAACKGNGSATTDSSKTTTVDSTKTTVVDTAKKDTSKKDTAAKMDTTKKM